MQDDSEDDDAEFDEYEPDEEDPLEQERKRAESLVFEGLDRVIASWSAPPKTLAHYTSIANAIRIIDEGEIWLFNAYTLNDEQEIDHSLDFIRDEIDATEFAELRSLLVETHEFPNRGRRSIYVFCLSPVDDLDRLSMWRAYGDDGNGVALKFRSKALIASRNAKMTSVTPILSEVVYNSTKKAEKINALFAEFEKLAARHQEFSRRDLLGALTAMLWKIVPTFKHEAFEEEREWRLIVEVKKPIFSVLPDSSSLIEFLNDRRPYIRLELGKAAGEGILSVLNPDAFDGALVGPSRNDRANAAAIGAALLKRQWSPLIETSAIPYRGRT